MCCSYLHNTSLPLPSCSLLLGLAQKLYWLAKAVRVCFCVGGELVKVKAVLGDLVQGLLNNNVMRRFYTSPSYALDFSVPFYHNALWCLVCAWKQRIAHHSPGRIWTSLLVIQSCVDICWHSIIVGVYLLSCVVKVQSASVSVMHGLWLCGYNQVIITGTVLFKHIISIPLNSIHLLRFLH